jgi:hypothetical protein
MPNPPKRQPTRRIPLVTEWPQSPVFSGLLFLTILAIGTFISFSTPRRLHPWSVFLTVFLLYPAGQRICTWMRARWRPAFTVAAIGLAFAALAAAILSFGEHQFAGFDCSLMVDFGWRLVQGQIPYRDFICTMPPGFFVAVKYAYQLFGVQWSALIYLNAIVACAGFLWLYWLLNLLLRQRLHAFFMALCMACAGFVQIGYFWHNSIASIAGAIFLLTCILYLKWPDWRPAQLSYVVSLGLLAMMKANTALPLMIGATILLLIVTPSKVRFLALNVVALAGVLLVFAANHISLPGLIASYRSAAQARGLTIIGWRVGNPVTMLRVIIYISIMLFVPLIRWCGLCIAAWRSRSLGSIALPGLLILGPIVGILAMSTNWEMKDTDYPLLICFCALMLWRDDAVKGIKAGGGKSLAAAIVFSPWTPRIYITLLSGLMITHVCVGYNRHRVEPAEHQFFEWTDNENNPGVPYFQHMRASRTLKDVVSESRDVLRTHPGPVFFGPAMEFGYAAFSLPSPRHVPVWWHTGTSYAVADTGAVVEAWRQNKFQTLIFVKLEEDSHLPQAIQQDIATLYVREDQWPHLIVFRRR